MLYLTSFKIAADFVKFSEYLTTNSYLSYLQLMLQEDIFVTRRHIWNGCFFDSLFFKRVIIK